MTETRQVIGIPYAVAASGRETRNSVLLEQAAWDNYTNLLTRFGVIAYLLELLGGAQTTTDNCAGGVYHIYAYPSPPSLPFAIGATHGDLSVPVIEDLPYTEAIQCRGEAEITPKYPPTSIRSFAWVGDVYGLEGDSISAPPLSLTADGLAIAVGSPAVGSVLCTYMVHRLTYTLAIEPLSGAVENALQAWIWAVWDAGNNVLECKFPAGAETGDCNNRRGGDSGTVEDKSAPPCVPAFDETKYVDWCGAKK